MLMINILGILLITGIVWWFWLYKPAELITGSGDSELLITVENGVYTPARFSVPSGQAASVKFLRKDASPCAGMVAFADLNISEELPLDKEKIIQLPSLSEGSYSFTCQMQMYRGELIVSDQ